MAATTGRLVIAQPDRVARVACQQAGWGREELVKLAAVRARNARTPLEETRASTYQAFLVWLRLHHRLDGDLEAYYRHA